MIPNNQKTSLLVPYQLPEWIREDPSYDNFVYFIQAYYEWMEQNGNVLDASKNILNYTDIDSTTDQFVNYFYNDFLPYFPNDVLADKRKLLKVARSLYSAKGTPASYQFLFRVLYNSDFEVFFTEDAVLKTSAGKWYVAKSLKLSTTDPRFLNLVNYRIVGETTKSVAVIENTVLAGDKTEVFISNIERLFQSGEFVRIVDSNNQDVIINGTNLRAKIVGQLSQITINPLFRGLLYQPNDPVVVYGGLNSNTGHGANATVGTVTTGSIQSITVNNGGFGYSTSPNTIINITNAPGAIATVSGVNPALLANATFIPIDYIGLKANVTIGNSTYGFANNLIANANTTFANAFTFVSLATYPISSVSVQNGGGGISVLPVVTAESTYQTVIGPKDLSGLGILAPIQILNGGAGYRINDTITISGGLGFGAYANISSINANGAITGVNYVYKSNNLTYPLGGLGYTTSLLPTVSVTSSNTQASNASLVITGILGSGAVLTPSVNRVGAITTINLNDPGQDYIADANVSLQVQDLLITGATITNLPTKGQILYQGASYNVSTYSATIDSIYPVTIFANTQQSIYNLRVYNFIGAINPALPFGAVNGVTPAGYTVTLSYPPPSGSRYNSFGILTYGDSSARANASFLDGLVLSSGQYLDTSGQPSSFDVLESIDYNSFTYQITVEKEIEKYRSTLLDLLHPSGTKVIGRFAMKSNAAYNYVGVDELHIGHHLSYYTNSVSSSVTINTNFTNFSNNIIKFNSLNGANLASFINTNSSIQMTTSSGDMFQSQVLSVNTSSNTVTMKDNVWLTFGNVAFVTAVSNNSFINIQYLTNSYNLVNGGVYSNTSYPLIDIIKANDTLQISNTNYTVTSVNYLQNIVNLSNNISNTTNSFVSINRPFTATNVIIFGQNQ